MSIIFDRLVNKIGAKYFVGCTQDELLALAEGRKLPKDYKQFMLLGGKGMGDFLIGEDVYFPRVLHLKNEAEELLQENNEHFRLPQEAFVFLMHQGYEFLYFDCSEENSKVYQYIEGMGSPKEAWSSFSSYLEDALSQYVSSKLMES